MTAASMLLLLPGPKPFKRLIVGPRFLPRLLLTGMIASDGKAMFGALDDNQLLPAPTSLLFLVPHLKALLDLPRAFELESEILVTDNDAQRQLHGID